MNHTGHILGGVIAGGVVCLIAKATGNVEFGWNTLNEIMDSPLSPTQNNRTVLGLFLTTLFMSLFPDLDVHSVFQRWCPTEL